MNVTVFIPSYGGSISTQTFISICKLMEACRVKAIEIGFATFGAPDIAEVRNIATSLWYDSSPQSTHLLMIDSDMGFEPQLILDMLLFDHPVVGAVYPKKTYPYQWVASRLPDTEFPPVKGPFMQVGGVGTGVFLVKRDTITKMIEHYSDLIDTRTNLHIAANMLDASKSSRILRLFDKLEVAEGWISEDLSFCRRWTDMGGEVWAHVEQTIVHVGPHEFRMSYRAYVDQQRQSHEAPTKFAVAAE